MSGLEELLRILQIVGARRSGCADNERKRYDDAATEPFARGVEIQHCVIFSRPYERVLILD